MPSGIVLNVTIKSIMLSVIMLSVVMQNVAAPKILSNFFS
jgi:hypothetical protein